MQNYFFIRLDKKNVKVNFQDIVFVEACKNYIQIITRQRSYMALLSMRQIEELLPPCQFCRIHRSYIISLNYLTAFDSSCIFLDEKITLPIGDQKITLPIGDQYKDVLPQKVKIVQSDVRKPPLTVGTFQIMETAN